MPRAKNRQRLACKSEAQSHGFVSYSAAAIPPTKNFVVFFGFNKSSFTADALAIMQDAVKMAKSAKFRRVSLTLYQLVGMYLRSGDKGRAGVFLVHEKKHSRGEPGYEKNSDVAPVSFRGRDLRRDCGSDHS
jgi:hypothetical protein